MKRAVIVFLVVLNLAICAKVINRYSVAPPIVEVDLTRQRSGFVIVSNDTDESYRIKITPMYFSPDEQKRGKHLNPDTAKIEDLSEFVVVSPRVVRLLPGARRMVRFSVRPGQKLEPGDYRCIFNFKPVEKEGADDLEEQEDKVVTQITWIIQLRIPFYGSYGKRDNAKIKVSAEVSEGKQSVLDITSLNEGVWRYPANFKVYDGSDTTPLADVKITINRETEQYDQIKLRSEPKNDSLRITWDTFIDDIPVDPGELTLSIKK